MADWDISTASEVLLVSICHKTLEKEGRIGGHVGGIAVVKISPQIAAKFGYSITASEAAAQSFAHKNFDPSVAYVPKVYRYFRRRRSTDGDEYGYLFMEYIPGQNLQDLDMESVSNFVPRVVKIVESLGRIGGSTPGPIGGGIPQGYIYGDDGAKAPFKSIEEMNAYMNKRLAYRNDTIDLSRHPLVFYHGDIGRRNIILRDDGSLCLVDWGFAGYYPRFFELVALKYTIPYDKLFEGALECEAKAAMELTDEERHDMKLVSCVRSANLRWLFDGPTQAEYDVFIESVERHAGIRKDDSVNGAKQAAAGDEKQDESHSTSQSAIKSDQEPGELRFLFRST